MSDFGEQFGDFLRSRREQLRPADVGVSDTRRRRTPGLRREEVATLAGISAEWYVKLEQGRAVAPSATTLDALARALRLTGAERTHLHTLARGSTGEAWSREHVPETLRRFVREIAVPAYVTGVRFDMLAWNAAAAALFGDIDALPVEDRNVLAFVLTDPRGRTLFGDCWADEASRMVAVFRAAHDRFAGDPAFVQLVRRLREGCPEFSTWWETHDIGAPVSGTKHLRHPDLGLVAYDFSSFQANDDPRLKLVVYMVSPRP